MVECSQSRESETILICNVLLFVFFLFIGLLAFSWRDREEESIDVAAYVWAA